MSEHHHGQITVETTRDEEGQRFVLRYTLWLDPSRITPPREPLVNIELDGAPIPSWTPDQTPCREPYRILVGATGFEPATP